MYPNLTQSQDYLFFFFLMIRRPPRSTLFPYTTLFRSDRDPVRFLAEVDDGAVHRLLRGVDVPNEVGDSPRVLVSRGPGFLLALIHDGDGQVLVQECHLLKPPGQRLERPLGGLEDRVVRPERDRGPGVLGGRAADQRAHRVAALV